MAICAMALTNLATAQTTEQVVLFEETFANCDGTGGNPTEANPDGLWSGTIANQNFSDSNADNEGWTLVGGKKANGCIRVGTTSAYGSATTPSITGFSSDETATLTFRAGSWYYTSGNPVSIYIYVGESETPIETVALEFSKFNEYSVEISNASSGDKITFKAKTQRAFFLDDVKVTVERVKSSESGDGEDPEEGEEKDPEEGNEENPEANQNPTAVKSPASINADAPIYNLQGQRVDSNAKGILIQNGKKIIRK